MLYVVGTPIGNLEDLSLRQAKTLASVAVILTEDTRTTGMLLLHIAELFSVPINPHQKLISYYKENEFEKLPQILDLIQEDTEIALISEAGMPLISDPGFLLIKTLIKQAIPFTVIPGPTAATTALVYSGFNPGEHMFLGFLPKQENEIRKVLHKVVEVKKYFKDMTCIVYESPHRVHNTLKLMQEILPDTTICICRELTKKFEEVVRGTPLDLQQREYKGEVVMLL